MGASSADLEAQGRRWWSHVQVLADDRMEGRDTASPGFDRAADYVVDQFRLLGLSSAGTEGFRQWMAFHVVRIDEPQCALELVHDGIVEPLRLGEDALLGVNNGSAESVDAEAVFVGYGLTIPEANWNDLSDQDLNGKIVVCVTGGPESIPSPLKAHYRSDDELRRAFARVGAAGAIGLENPKAAEIPWSRRAKYRFQPQMELEDPGQEAPPHFPVGIWYNVDRAEKLFAHSGHTFQEIRAAVKADHPLPHFPLHVRIRCKSRFTRSRARCQNVVGRAPGGDPGVRDEVVVISAHLDHVGIGEPVQGDPIYSGAMDNASGVASLIEVARAIRAAPTPPRRSILFLAVTGEEKGLLGSQYFATHPTVAGPIVADLNMDMFNPFFPFTCLEVIGLAESTLGEDARAVAERAGVAVLPDQLPDHARFIRSDQYSFIRQGVPALAFKIGYRPGTPEEKVVRAWYAERYHAPSDDLEQPVDRRAAAQFNALLAELALRVANADQRPAWKSDSFFRRFAR
jgi:hypothetical protein